MIFTRHHLAKLTPMLTSNLVRTDFVSVMPMAFVV